MSAITLNDDLNYYDEYIVYGSGYRGNLYLDTQNRYFVSHNEINQGGPYYAGRWSDTETYILLNGTEMWLSGTSGYISSSYFIGEGNNTTAWAQGIFNNRNHDVHPYKIVGIKEIQ